jgi:quercetin dioxygenase-like cupin family protein
VDRWHLPSVDATGKREPRVLFSRAECRGVVIDLQAGEQMGDHSVHESALVQVMSGRIVIVVDGREVEAGSGTLAVFEPGERRSVRAVESSRLLLLLVPWPGKGHYHAGEEEHLPVARAQPLAD